MTHDLWPISQGTACSTWLGTILSWSIQSWGSCSFATFWLRLFDNSPINLCREPMIRHIQPTLQSNTFLVVEIKRLAIGSWKSKSFDNKFQYLSIIVSTPVFPGFVYLFKFPITTKFDHKLLVLWFSVYLAYFPIFSSHSQSIRPCLNGPTKVGLAAGLDHRYLLGGGMDGDLQLQHGAWATDNLKQNLNCWAKLVFQMEKCSKII